MNMSLHLLLVAEREAEAAVAAAALRRADYDVRAECVSNPQAMRMALARQAWDAVVCADHLSQFDTPAALALMREFGFDVPFLVLSGAANEADGPMIRSSARDYQIKDEATGLIPAMERELRSAAMRRERRRLMEASLDAARDWQATFDAIGDAICLLDADGCVRRVNRAFTRLAGPADSDVLGQPCGDILARLGALPATGPFPEARANLRRATCDLDLRGRTFALVVDPLFDADGAFVGAVQIMTDISDRVRAETAMTESRRQLETALENLRQAQDTLVRQERLNALGQMVSGVAHDFNNVLMPILGLPQMLLEQPEQLDNRERVTAVLRSIVSAATDAREIVRRLREFYQPNGRVERQAVDVNTLVERAILLTEPVWKVQVQAEERRIRIEHALGCPPVIWGHEASLREVITNLLLNAIDAIPSEGVIGIATAAEESGAVIRVSDTGTGMTAETKQHLFEPFFTTKGANGSGLGLAASYGIIQRHGGSIEVTSELGKGSVFTIHLPVAKPPPSAVRQALPADIHAEVKKVANLAVLLADDEEPSRALLQTFLNHAGFRVVAVHNGEAAVAQLRMDRFDVLLTDRAMPGMGGDALAREAKRIAPDMPVVMLTGFGGLMLEQAEQPESVDLVLGKPLTCAELLHAVRQAIDHAKTGSGAASAIKSAHPA